MPGPDAAPREREIFNLATAYYLAGRLTDAVAMLERALADCREHLGPGHPITETVQENLDAALP